MLTKVVNIQMVVVVASTEHRKEMQLSRLPAASEMQATLT